jgi:Holliday junction resolvase RusA-like endonuclease
VLSLTLSELTKISLNKWYTGMHWSKRNRLKNEYKHQVKSQFKGVFSKDKRYEISFIFYFKSKPLDSDNTGAMIKLINDIIFEDDKWDILDIGYIRSRKDKNERVEIKIEELSEEI